MAVGRELVRRFPGLEVVVFEKEDRVGAHQTGHNSGVVHAGIYYAPGSLKAQLCTRGRVLLGEFCAERGLPYDECGKLVVAVDRGELGRLDELERRSRRNGVPGLRRISAPEIADVEPAAVGVAALHSPATAITDFVAVAHGFADDIVAAGGQVRLGNAVMGIRHRRGAVEVATGTRVHRVAGLVICAGLQSDRVAGLAGGESEPAIVPFRGEYLQVDPAKQDLVRGMVYPVPDPAYPFLGVHFTRRVTGALEVGPNAVLALAREGYGWGDIDLGDLAELAAWPGTWQLARAHWRTGVREVWGSLSSHAYMRAASRYVPAIGPDDVTRARAGVRAQAVDRDGSLVDDFRITVGGDVVSVRNAPSPAATSSLAIAEHVVDRLPSWA